MQSKNWKTSVKTCTSYSLQEKPRRRMWMGMDTRFCGWLFLSAYFESCKVRRASELIRFGEILIEFVDCGVPINYTNDCSRTFLDDYIKAVPDQLRFYPPGNVEHLAYRRILGDLVDKGAMATAPSQYERRLDAPTYKCLGQFEQVAEVWKIGPLSQAVLARQELAVLRLLTSRGDYLKERDWRGRTPCHLASDWPRGLRLLLEFNCDADMPDYEGDTPILCASKGGHHEVVQMLLDHGVTFPSASGCKEQVEWGTILFCSLQWPFFTMLLDALKDRRRELLRLATSHPQAQPPSTVGVCPGYLPDAQAASICNLLTRNGITIPNALRIPSDWATIYHYLSPYCEEAKLDYIYNTGFKDIDVPDDKDHTPIERLAGWQMGLGPPLFLWLIKKRVELDRVTNWCNDLRWKSSSYPLLNLIGWSMAEWLSDGVMALLGKPEQLHISHYTPELPYGPHLSDWWMEIATKENKAVIQAGRRMGDLLKLVLTSERRDDCVCLCFLGGCTPAFMVLKRLYDPDFDFNSSAGSHSNHWKGIWSVNGEEGLNDLQSDLVDHLCERRPREVVRTISLFLAGNPAQVQWALSVIRFETFAKLQLRHTCCWFKTHWLNWIVNPEDVTDAHEEDEESIAVLENLVKEFEEKFLELQDDEYDVVDFLNGYWAVRMDQVLTENPVDPDAVRKMKEIGVVLDKDPVERTEQPRSTRDSWPRYRFWERPGTPY
ncbi:hypothetical protein EV356DRAFT_370603 [Viridothelium virens]|uniref:Uncharacterized protein n=1 Tax=Viridothelium virens TaxID=1048519 RepID=A0A6A6GVI1_VIRVR|nr:hypothetical protein EV356DRAFT_370603 [Viridothelium virens]